MKIIGLFAALLLVAAFVAFKERDVTASTFTIDGLWEGKIGTDPGTPSGQYAVKIKSDGIIERVNSSNTVTAYGTWQLNGSNFAATYNYSNGTIVSITGTMDKDKNKLTATWENNGNEEGTLFANKTIH